MRYGRLWARPYQGDKENGLQKVMGQWKDAEWLADFFMQNFDDLMTYFKVTYIEEATYQTMEERQHTLIESEKTEKVRTVLLNEKIFDDDSFTDYQKEVEP